jgi:hypothetical protein
MVFNDSNHSKKISTKIRFYIIFKPEDLKKIIFAPYSE